MNIFRKSLVPLGCMLSALALQGCTTVPDDTAVAAAAPEAAPIGGEGPALWRLADEDTTIYLFGTVHALRDNVDWYKGKIPTALGESGELVTEIPDGVANDPQTQQMMMGKAMLPADQNLRDLLTEEQRATYEAAMVQIGMEPGSFDRLEPWFAGMTLGVVPLLKAGWNPENGGEKIVEARASAEAKRSALETMEEQIAIFDGMPQETQIDFLMAASEGMDEYIPMMERMVEEWLAGNPAELAAIMNESLKEPAIAKALLYDRNARWAEWIDTRMDQPGQVFVAVGAGHLAGDRSVQDYLAERGIKTTRVQ